MRTLTDPNRVLCITAAIVWATTAGASVVVTQVEERAFFSLWLLSQHIEQRVAHNLIIDNHDVVVVATFTAQSLAGADVVYISPSIDQLQITQLEIDALEQFVIDGGRLIIPGDYGQFAPEIIPIAARFDVIYGTQVINGVYLANSIDFDNPIVNGPAGMVNSFTGSAVNGELSSDNKDFRVLATWSPGPISIGFLEVGAGEVVFLTDFNTWDGSMINDFDNQTLWLNLFEYSACPVDLDGDGTVGASDLLSLLVQWGSDPGGPPDFDGDGTVGASDLLTLLVNWGPCG